MSGSSIGPIRRITSGEEQRKKLPEEFKERSYSAQSLFAYPGGNISFPATIGMLLGKPGNDVSGAHGI